MASNEVFSIRPCPEQFALLSPFKRHTPPLDISPFTVPKEVIASHNTKESKSEALSSNQPISNELVRCLLLDCDDWRSIYFTCWLNHVSPHEHDRKKKLDVTTCDQRVENQARNLVLFAALLKHDETQLEHLWSLFACSYLPNPSTRVMLLDLLSSLKADTKSEAAFQQSPLSAYISIESSSLSLLHQWFEKLVTAAQKGEDLADRKGPNEPQLEAQAASVNLSVGARNMDMSEKQKLRLREVTVQALKRGWTDAREVLRGCEKKSKSKDFSKSGASSNLPTACLTSSYLFSPFEYFSHWTTFSKDPRFVRAEALNVSSDTFLLASSVEQFGRWVQATRLALQEQRLHVRVMVGASLDCCDLLASPPSASGLLMEYDGNEHRRLPPRPDWPARFEFIHHSNSLCNLSTMLLPALICAAPLLNHDFAQSVLRTDFDQPLRSIGHYFEKDMALPLDLLPLFLGIRLGFYESCNGIESLQHCYRLRVDSCVRTCVASSGDVVEKHMKHLSWHPVLNSEAVPVSLARSKKIQDALRQLLLQCTKPNPHRLSMATFVRFLHSAVLRSAFSDLSLHQWQSNSKVLQSVLGEDAFKTLGSYQQDQIKKRREELALLLHLVGLASSEDLQSSSVVEVTLPFNFTQRLVNMLVQVTPHVFVLVKDLVAGTSHIFWNVRLNFKKQTVTVWLPDWMLEPSRASIEFQIELVTESRTSSSPTIKRELATARVLHSSFALQPSSASASSSAPSTSSSSSSQPLMEVAGVEAGVSWVRFSVKFSDDAKSLLENDTICFSQSSPTAVSLFLEHSPHISIALPHSCPVDARRTLLALSKDKASAEVVLYRSEHTMPQTPHPRILVGSEACPQLLPSKQPKALSWCRDRMYSEGDLKSVGGLHMAPLMGLKNLIRAILLGTDYDTKLWHFSLGSDRKDQHGYDSPLPDSSVLIFVNDIFQEPLTESVFADVAFCVSTNNKVMDLATEIGLRPGMNGQVASSPLTCEDTKLLTQYLSVGAERAGFGVFDPSSAYVAQQTDTVFESSPFQVPFVPAHLAKFFVRAALFPIYPPDPILAFPTFYGNPDKRSDEQALEVQSDAIPDLTHYFKKNGVSPSDLDKVVDRPDFQKLLSSLFPDRPGFDKVTTVLPEPPTSGKQQCSHCMKTSGKLLLCSGCKSERYCSADHQKAHWPKHKAECKKLKAARKSEWSETSTGIF